MLFEDIEAGAEGSFVIERLVEPSGQACRVALCRETSPSLSCRCYRSHDRPWWIIERREGSAEQHFVTGTFDMREAHEIVTEWAYEHSSGARASIEWTRLR